MTIETPNQTEEKIALRLEEGLYFELGDEAVGEILAKIQEATIDGSEGKATELLREIRVVPSEEENGKLVPSILTDEHRGFTDTVIAQLQNLLLFSLVTRTPFIDHVRVIKFQHAKDKKYDLTQEYIVYFNEMAQKLADKAQRLQRQEQEQAGARMGDGARWLQAQRLQRQEQETTITGSNS